MKRLIAALALLLSIVPFVSAAIKSAQPPYPAYGSIERLDPQLDQLLAPDARMEKLAEGFSWTEGPVWVPAEHALLISDMPENVIYRWRDGVGVDVFLRPSGYTGDKPDGTHVGSNGLLLDPHGRLLLCQHGDRRIARLNLDGRSFTTIADNFEGKRFNSPNDLVLDAAGNLYFTDPPYGVGPHTVRDMDYQGVFRVTPAGKVTLLIKDMARPNGIGLSPDGKILYVSDSDEGHYAIYAHDLHTDGTVGPRRLIFNAAPFSSPERPGSTDGMKIDARGNIWTTSPGGIYVLSPEGKHLGTLHTGQPNGNCRFGGEDGTTFFIMANNAILRIRTLTKGAAN